MAEAVIAIFMLLSAFVVMARLFITGLNYEKLVDTEQNAIFLAESQMEEIRGWSAQTHQPAGSIAFSNWSGCPGQPGPITKPGFPGYDVTVNSTVEAIYSPCSSWELQYPLANNRRTLKQSCRRVRVSVSWGGRLFQIESLVAVPIAPPATAVSIQVSGPGSISQDGVGSFTAVANGPSGVLPDVMFNWYVYGVGVGTIVPDRDGATARLGHYLLDAATPPVVVGYGSGPCYMRALGRVRGKEVWGDSSNVDLP